MVSLLRMETTHLDNSSTFRVPGKLLPLRQAQCSHLCDGV